MNGARARLEAEQDARAWHAWHVAALGRCKELPELREMLSPRGPGQPQERDELQAMFNVIAANWGAGG